MADDSMQYHIRWNNHLPNMLTVFRHLFETETLTDVTLWLNNGKATVKCHKIILVASSLFFQDLLTEMPYKRHPHIILPQVTVSDMMPILNYIYRGEVNVAQENLKNLLTLANALQVKGLINSGDSENYEEKIDAALSPPETTSSTTNNAQQSSEHISIPHSTGGSYQINDNSELDLPEQSLSHSLWEYAGHHMDPESNYERKKTPIKEELMNEEPSVIRNMLVQDLSGSGENARSRKSSSSHSNESTNGRGRRSANYLGMGHNPSRARQEDGSGSQGASGSTLQGSIRNNPVHKAEWKKYKQYTNADLQQALKAMEMGLSPSAAAKKFKVPSRTLYDKAKKMGINMRKIKRDLSRRSSNSDTVAFPIDVSRNVNGGIIYRNSSNNEYEESNGNPTENPSASKSYATHQQHNTPMDVSGSSENLAIPPSRSSSNENAIQDLSVKDKCENSGVIKAPPKRELK